MGLFPTTLSWLLGWHRNWFVDTCLPALWTSANVWHTMTMPLPGFKHFHKIIINALMYLFIWHNSFWVLYYFDRVFMSWVTSPCELKTWATVTSHSWLWTLAGKRFNFQKKKISARGPVKIEWTLALMNTFFFFHVTDHSMQWTPLPMNTKGHTSQAMNAWSK